MSVLHRILVVASFFAATALFCVVSSKMEAPEGVIPALFACVCAGLAILVIAYPKLVSDFLKEARGWMQRQEHAPNSASGESGDLFPASKEKKPSRLRRFLNRHPYYPSKRRFGIWSNY